LTSGLFWLENRSVLESSAGAGVFSTLRAASVAPHTSHFSGAGAVIDWKRSNV
jgi:hypothetical protein